MERNIFLYWVGNEYKLIKILRNIIYLHSTNGIGYKVHLITHSNINEYITVIPDYFYTLCPAHQADFVRVYAICDYGGIWLDSDTLVIDSLDPLFKLLDDNDGFFVKENNTWLCNGVFGSKKQTPLMHAWKNNMLDVLNTHTKINWTDIGSLIINSLYDKNTFLYNKYIIFNGLDTMFPLKGKECARQLIKTCYNNYKRIERSFQPLLFLTNTVYKSVEHWTVDEIMNNKNPLKYFLNKSYGNMNHLKNYDFIEIGTSNFNTLIEKAEDEYGISVDAVKYYINALPDKPNVKKLNIGISDTNGSLDIYYIPENIIEKKKLQPWFKGCNSIGKYHPAHIIHKVQHLVVKENVKVITCYELFYQNSVRKLKYLKIDTEGHDTVIMGSLFEYIKFLPKQFYPQKILFESNVLSAKDNVDKTINNFISIGYVIVTRDHDTIIEFNE